MLYSKEGSDLIESRFLVNKLTGVLNKSCLSRWYTFQESEIVINMSVIHYLLLLNYSFNY